MLKSLALASASACALFAVQAHAAILAVTANAGVLAAIQAAQPGDVVTLSGAVTAIPNLTGIVKAAPGITVTSANPSARTVVGDLVIKNSAGLSFTDLDFAETGPAGTATGADYVGASQNITFDHDAFHGPAAATAAIAANTGPGNLLGLQNDTGVTVTNSTFSAGNRGMTVGESANVAVRFNSFHDLGSDGVDCTTVTGYEVAFNTFTDFWTVPGDHPDAIQCWTAGAKSPSVNINVHDNVFSRGAGNAAQGVFLTDQNEGLSPDPTVFQAVQVTGNLLIGTMGNAIDVSGACNVTISGNQVDAFPGAAAWVRYDHLCGAQAIAGNLTATVGEAGGPTAAAPATLASALPAAPAGVVATPTPAP
jgi:hypothetical protein